MTRRNSLLGFVTMDELTYEAACEQLLQAYRAACAPHWQAYMAACEPHRQTYEAACEPHRQAYMAACEQHRQVFEAAKMDFYTKDELAYEARVEQLTRKPDWEAILVKFERADLVELIAEMHADHNARYRLVWMVEEWAMDRAADDLAKEAANTDME